MNISRYTGDRQPEWDDFVRASRNGTFLFERAYMDYHGDRFLDHSLIFTDTSHGSGKIIALLPANEVGHTLHSHQGLTYGGFILSKKVHITQVGELFQTTLDHLRQQGFTHMVYKQMPSVYHLLPSQEDTYWLWRSRAEKTACNVMTAVDLHRADQSPVSARKHTYSNRMQRQGYTVSIDAPLEAFWPILEANLQERFQAKPVHTLVEIRTLQRSFPRNIVCCTVQNPHGQVVAGTVLFISQQVVRTQYISASHEGRGCNALDFLMLSLIRHYQAHPQYRYFDFGTSMAEDGTSLNEGLEMQKEGFGARSIACNTYSIDTSIDIRNPQS